MTNTMRCKMRVISVGMTENGHTVSLRAVYDAGNNAENKAFFESTPNGLFEATVKNKLGKEFTPGAEFYIDLIPASGD